MPDELTAPTTDVTSSDTPSTASKRTTGVDNKDIAKKLKTRVESSIRERERRVPDIKRNIEARVGKVAYPGATTGVIDEGEVRTEINPDWALTKTKTANLYSQVPAVQGTHVNKVYGPAVPLFMREMNYQLSEKRMNVGVAMEEVLCDTVNAAGIGGVMVGYAARFDEPRQVPSMDTKMLDPAVVQQLIASGKMPMKTTRQRTDYRFFCHRISPNDLIVPTEFNGSNFDDADFKGFSGRCSWAEAKTNFKLKDSQKEDVLAQGDSKYDKLRLEDANSDKGEIEYVYYDELYYWRYRYDPTCKSFSEIWKIVYVKGLTDPAIHEPWEGQKLDPQSYKYIGACKLPVRILTLTYITDNPIPPSDTAAGRPQVNDLRLSRSQMFAQRRHSIPIRWFDSNRIDPLVQTTLMRGTWQGMIPTNGDGSRSIGEIARASYPSENLEFDRKTQEDLLGTWQIGPNQAGTTQGGRTTAEESGIVQQNFATRIGQERGAVAAFFLSICEVLAGWMVLYSDFPTLTPEERQTMEQAWDMGHVLHDLVLKIRPDSQLVLDSSQRLDRIAKFINLTAKSGYVNVKPLIIEMAELSDIDPTDVVIDPTPPQPEPPNISYRFSGKDDMINNIVLATLAAAGKLPTAEDLQKANQFLLAAQQATPPAPPAPPVGPSSQPGAGDPGASPLPPPGGGAPAGQSPVANPQPPEEANQHWNLASKIGKRSADLEA